MTLAPKVAELLPRSQARVAAVGCGSSFNIAKIYARLRERAGEGETDFFASSELSATRRYDHYVFFSRTGRTSETIVAAERVAGTGTVTAVTAAARGPITQVVDHALVVAFADERAVITTRYFTSVVVLLRAHLGEDLTALPIEGQAALMAEIPYTGVVGHPYVFLGRGWSEGVADEATLKLRETAQVWSESHNAMEYRHGPISLAERGALIWSMGMPPPGLEQEVRSTGAQFEHRPVDPLADLVRVQRLAIALAEARGLSPDQPRHLTRSVVLGGRELSVARANDSGPSEP